MKDSLNCSVPAVSNLSTISIISRGCLHNRLCSHTSLICSVAPVAHQHLPTKQSQQTHINLDLFPIRIFYRRVIALYPYILYKLCWT